MRKPTPQEQLRMLRRYRTPKARDLSIAGEVEALRARVTRRAGAFGGLDEAWATLVPPGLSVATKLVRLTPGGVLHVEGDSAAACYELDQWKRAGGLAELRAQCSVTLKDVRVSVGKKRR